MSNYTFNLPKQDGSPEKHTVEHNSLIIIGANGAGKSMLGAWMERNSMDVVHRISAQRSLNFSKFTPLKSEIQASNLLLTGNEDSRSDKHSRWGDYTPSTLKLLTDYNHVLSLVFAKLNKENDSYMQKCKEHERAYTQLPPTPKLITERIIRIWNAIFQHLQINLMDGTVKALKNMAIPESHSVTSQYDGVQMSDGERVALYLIAQALCVPEGKTVIIDEPELHLHRSIMNQLWDEVENERKDCLFIYITHDTQFAAAHKQAQKIWVKNYYDKKWDYEVIDNSDLPENLLLDILGNRKDVIFVEGTKDSYDTALYSEIYKNHYIVPCGSCSSVISNVKAFQACKQLHHIKCFGIIDRDFRPDNEINSLKSKGVYTLEVAEVENLFLVEEVLKALNAAMSKPDDSGVCNTIEYIKNRYKTQTSKMIAQSIKSEMKFQIENFDFSSADADIMKDEFNSNILNKFSRIQSDAESKFNSALTPEDYALMLKYFNEKSLIGSVGHYYGLKNDLFCEQILNFMRDSHRDVFINAIEPYLPNEIPIS